MLIAGLKMIMLG